jgi:hypothetical protein
MTTFFVLCDSGERHFPELLNTPFIGPFIKGGVAATVGWWCVIYRRPIRWNDKLTKCGCRLIWPFENLKSQIQGNTPGPNKLWDRFFWTLRTGGVKSLFRGFVPGTWRSIIANGASMLAFQVCQDIREKYVTPKKA